MRGPTPAETPVQFDEILVKQEERNAIEEYLFDSQYFGPEGYYALECVLIREIHRRDGVAWRDVPELCLAIGLAVDGSEQFQRSVWGLLTDSYPEEPEPRPRDALRMVVDSDHSAVDFL